MDSGTGSQEFIYVPSGANACFVITAPTPTTFGAAAVVPVMNYDVWTSPGEVASNSRNVTINAGKTCGQNSLFVITGEGQWVRPTSINYASASAALNQVLIHIIVTSATTLSWADSAVDFGTITLSGAVNPCFTPLVANTEFASTTLPWFSARTTAAAVLCTNVTQLLNKGGTILCGRAAPSVYDPWQITYSTINKFHPAEKAFLPYETGAYSFCPPSTDLALFWDYVLTSNAGVVGFLPLYRLDNDAMVNHLYFSSPSGVSETLAITCDWHIEFRTSSALFQIGLSTITLEAFHQAQVALCAAGFFFENPLHKDILFKVIQAVKKYAPLLAGVVSPGLGAALRAGVQMLPDKPKNVMKTTTLSGSGMADKKPPVQGRRKKKVVVKRPKRSRK
jgi:hypothetical protein